MSACPYHSSRWRAVTQCVINSMRGINLISGCHCRVFPRLVCVCPSKGSKCSLPRLSQDILVSWINNLIVSKPEDEYIKLAPPVKLLYEGCLHTQREEEKEALMRILLVIYQVCHGNTDILEPNYEAIKSPDPQDSILPEPEPESDLETKVFYLDIPTTPIQYIGTLIGKNGIHLKALCEKYSIISIHLGEEREKGGTRTGRRRNKPVYIYSNPVKVTCQFEPGNERVSLFEAALNEKVEEIKKKREQHFQNCQSYRKAQEERARAWRKQREMRQAATLDANLDQFIDSKEVAQNKFSNKQGKNKDKERTRNKGSTPILTDSRCLHCLGPYSAEQSECQYHPGFIIDKRHKKKKFKAWNCCGRGYRSDTSIHEEHLRTGCTTGQHIWRPHKSSKAHSKLSTSDKDSREDIVVMATNTP